MAPNRSRSRSPSNARANSISAIHERAGITRKVTACEACRKQKIKCNMDGGPPCSRCTRRGLSCTLNRSLQSLIEDNTSWKTSTEERLCRLEAVMHSVTNKLSLPMPSDASDDTTTNTSPVVLMASRPETSSFAADNLPEEDTTPVSNWRITVNPVGGPAAIPASIMSPSPQTAQSSPANSAPRAPKDLIDRGILSLDQAQTFFNYYRHRLDSFLYSILGDISTISTARSRSSLLVAATCTVGALHDRESGSHLFSNCLKEFIRSCAAHVFSNQNSIDDIRALCIGAFWLKDISWILVGAAVRIATEMRLFLKFSLALSGDAEAHEAVRLFYFVYVCDHHSSIVYGRPPMTRDCDAVSHASWLLESPNATEDDARLISQVKLWSLADQIFNTFGADVDEKLQPEKLPPLRRFLIALDSWRADWNERFKPNVNVGNYPKKGVALHFHFAKLYLCSHIFRGIRGASDVDRELLPEAREVAMMATVSATSILRVIVVDPEFRSFLNGLPLYFDTMIAFAAVFLLKVVSEYSTFVYSDSSEIVGLVEETQRSLETISVHMHPNHLLVSIAAGLGQVLSHRNKTTAPGIPISTDTLDLGAPAIQDDATSVFDRDWNMLDSSTLAPYDFLSDHNIMSGFSNFPLDTNFSGASDNLFSPNLMPS